MTENKFLSFYVGANNTAVIPLQNITEIFQVSLTEICNVPQVPSCVLGIYNWRGEMLWVVDLEEMLGYTPRWQEINFLSKMMAILLQNEDKHLGLLVRQIIDIELRDPKQIKAPETHLFSPEMIPFLQGYFINESEEMIISLDAASIIQSSVWKAHQ